MKKLCKIIILFCIAEVYTLTEAASELSITDPSNCTEDRIYHKSRSLCFVKAGKECLPENKDCVPNSQCGIGFVGFPEQYKYICTCDSETYKTLNGTCEPKPIYGESCDNVDKWCRTKLTYKGTQISSNLGCENKTCLCKGGTSPTPNDVDPLTNGDIICWVKPGYYCLPKNKCVPNAECEYGICKCKPGFFIRSNGSSQTCEKCKQYGESCEKNEECDEGKHLICNSELKKCVCSNETYHQRNVNKCLKREGSRCNRDSPQECTFNSYCYTGAPYNPRCQCFENATTSPIRNDGYCYIKENFDCNTNSKYFKELPQNSNYSRVCRPGLVCQNYTCSCEYKAHQIYSESEERCISLVEGPCTKNEDCVASSECVNGSEGINFCRCKSGFTPVDRRCDLAHGENCTQHDRSVFCDRIAPLGCSTRGKCECMGLQIYYEKEGRCRALVGGKCDENIKCADAAVCNKFRSRESGESGVCRCADQFGMKKDRSCAVQGGKISE